MSTGGADTDARLAAALPADPQAAARLAEVEAEAEKRLLADMAARRALAEESMQFAVGTSACGFCFSLVGFGLWWWRHQRHQDRLVELAVRRAEREARHTPTAG